MSTTDLRGPGRPPVLFVSWAFVRGRCSEIAEALGGASVSVYDPRFSDRRIAPLRYLVSSVITAAILVWRRPRSVIVTNPPIFPGLVAFAYGRLTGTPVVLDSHPGAFGRKDDRVSARMLPVHRWLARRSAAVMVTADGFVEEVQSWGGRGVVVHEAPPAWRVEGPSPAGERPNVLFVAVFAKDEPVAEVVEAARRLPDCDVLITGDVRKAPPGLVESAPANVDFVGFVPEDEYVALLEGADVVVALTTEPLSVMRSAYEAVYARRPLVVTDWPELRSLFPFAVPTGNDTESLADAIRVAVDERDCLVGHVEEALALQDRRWDEQLAALRRSLQLEAESTSAVTR
jgi:glycosyltransferase involved in cell wall biosynthesis